MVVKEEVGIFEEMKESTAIENRKRRKKVEVGVQVSWEIQQEVSRSASWIVTLLVVLVVLEKNRMIWERLAGYLLQLGWVLLDTKEVRTMERRAQVWRYFGFYFCSAADNPKPSHMLGKCSITEVHHQNIWEISEVEFTGLDDLLDGLNSFWLLQITINRGAYEQQKFILILEARESKIMRLADSTSVRPFHRWHLFAQSSHRRRCCLALCISFIKAPIWAPSSWSNHLPKPYVS